jgi:hypothetical protein
MTTVVRNLKDINIGVKERKEGTPLCTWYLFIHGGSATSITPLSSLFPHFSLLRDMTYLIMSLKGKTGNEQHLNLSLFWQSTFPQKTYVIKP